MEYKNSYSDEERALAYSKLEFFGTYYLAFRDISELLNRYCNGEFALDFGCGVGRSTRLLQSLGFQTIGVDISHEMLKIAREKDIIGNYINIKGDNLHLFDNDTFNIIFSAFTFDNIFTKQVKAELFNEFRRVLQPEGIVINIVSSPELYTNDWLSFKTTCFPNNYLAQSGDIVNTIIVDVGDDRPVEDELCSEKDYRELYASAGFEIVHIHKPLGNLKDPFVWLNEDKIPPWTIYVLKW